MAPRPKDLHTATIQDRVGPLLLRREASNRDRESTHAAPRLSVGDIVRSIQSEPYWIPPLKNRKYHQARANGALGAYWAISLEEAPQAAADDDGEETIFLFPQAQAFLDAISTKEDIK